MDAGSETAQMDAATLEMKQRGFEEQYEVRAAWRVGMMGGVSLRSTRHLSLPHPVPRFHPFDQAVITSADAFTPVNPCNTPLTHLNSHGC